MANPPAETDGPILARMGTDALKWAEEFNATVQEHPDIPRDMGALISWFANAIEAGRAAGRRETCSHLDRVELTADLTLCGTCGKDVTGDEAS